MNEPFDRRNFLKVSGMSLGIGALITVAPGLADGAQASTIRRWFHRQHGEEVAPFHIVQLSDAHVGFSGPPNPTGTKAFEHAIDVINGLEQQPDLILFTGDLTHESEAPGEHAKRMELFQAITSRLKAKTKVRHVPGEHDASLDGGALYSQFFGPTHYAFDHKGVHFIALDNVSSGTPAVGGTQIEWMKRDLARYANTVPIIVFTHRPLFDLRPDWEWFTRDGDDVLNVLAPYENVTILYGHIHRHDEHHTDHAMHYASRSLAFAFPDPSTSGDKKPLPFDKEQPFKNLGLQLIAEKDKRAGVNDVELSLREFAGIDGMQQIAKSGVFQ